jgi:tetratricopeptide (TPR) repeat protein
MNEIWNKIGEKKILPSLWFGQRWIFLAGALAIFALYQAFTVLLKFEPVNTLVSPNFIGGSIAIIAACLVVYAILTRGPPTDRFRIVVAGFCAAAENALDEAKNTRDRLIENLHGRELAEKVSVEVVPVEEVVDGRSLAGRKRAEKLAKQYRAHMVLGGTVRLDQEYYLAPFIVTRFHHPFELSLTEVLSAKVSAEQSLSLKELKESETRQEATLAAVLTGIAKIGAGRYEEAKEILASVPDSAPVWFYRGFALLQLKQAREAFCCFVAACEMDNNYADAWLYAGFALQSLGDEPLAQMLLALWREPP